ncbi:MAG: hypothetical protein ACLRVD_02020 [Blautia caecimuris]
MPEADFSAEAEAEEDFGSIEIPSESPGASSDGFRTSSGGT